MSYQTEIRDAVESYLESEFTDAEIKEVMDEESYSFRINKSTQTHFVRVMFSTVEKYSAGDIADLLVQFSVAETMRNLGDFPVAVTESGCMFGSP